MDSALSLSKKFHKFISTLSIVVCFFSSPNSFASTTSELKLSYKDIKEKILKATSTAKVRIWVASQFFSDADLATAIGLAKFRNLDVKVLMSEQFKQHYASQELFLYKENILVNYSDSFWKQFKEGERSVVVVDEKVFFLNALLAAEFSRGSLQLKELALENSLKAQFVALNPQSMQAITVSKQQSSPGKAYSAKSYSSAKRPPTTQRKAPESKLTHISKNSQDISRTLPRMTKWQIKQKGELAAKDTDQQ